jgi:hypothetical protein
VLLRKYISLSLITVFTAQTLSPVRAMEMGTDGEKAPSTVKKQAPLTVLGISGKTGAGILHYALKDGFVSVLLGCRDDSTHKLGDWCNFGGGSGPQKVEGLTPQTNQPTGFLHEDAARESCEESNGIYAPHPELLKHRPFIDTLTKKSETDFYYRLYWEAVNYVDSQIFRDKLKQEGLDHHNKEYTDFRWIPVHNLWKAVESKTDIVTVGDQETHLYDPLFKSLSTRAGLAFLKKLDRDKTLENQKIRWDEYLSIYTYSSSLRDFKNRAYVLENGCSLKEFWSESPLVDNWSESPLVDKRKQLAYAVSAHGMVLVQLKRHFQKDLPLPVEEEVPGWDFQSPETLSRIHLRLVLGPDYKTPENFKGDQRQADLANIEAYFSRYLGKEVELKRPVEVLNSDYELFLKALEFETKHKQWPTFYHGASENMNNLFKSFTYLREMMTLSPLDHTVALRGTDIYFRDHKNLKDFTDSYGAEENMQTSNAMLFLNFAIFACQRTTETTSSSVEYLLNNHSVNEPGMTERFEEALALAGFSNPTYVHFQSLFEQYVRYQNPPYGNSLFIAIAQTPRELDQYNYPTGGGGSVYKHVSSTSEILSKIQEEGKRILKNPHELFELEQDRKKKLFAENRLILNPERVMDPSQTRIKIFDRFPLNDQDQKVYDEAMRRISVALLGDWLAQHTSIIEGSFTTFPVLKTLYKWAYKKNMPEPLVENPPIDGFLYLIKNGYVSAVQNYYETYPGILTNSQLDRKTLIKSALGSYQLEI